MPSVTGAPDAKAIDETLGTSPAGAAVAVAVAAGVAAMGDGVGASVATGLAVAVFVEAGDGVGTSAVALKDEFPPLHAAQPAASANEPKRMNLII
jgi:hypothetical protein